MKHVLPDDRLSAAADLVRQGAVFADIGTDHAILPVFLCERGIVLRAIAADINEGPLAAARRQVEESGLSDKIALRLTDGLTGLENEGLTDIAICGMGGELIVSILSRASFLKSKTVRLILQPMTHAADVRRYLAREGFAVTDERVAHASGKTYFCFAATFVGVPYPISRIEAELGKDNLSRVGTDPLITALAERKRDAQAKKCRGLAAGGVRDAEEEEYLEELNALLGKETV